MANEIDIKIVVQPKILKALIDLAILVALKNRFMTAYKINQYLKIKTGFAVSLSVLYTVLSNLERNGLIKCAQNTRGRVYGLTQKGEKMGQEIDYTRKECKLFINNLLT